MDPQEKLAAMFLDEKEVVEDVQDIQQVLDAAEEAVEQAAQKAADSGMEDDEKIKTETKPAQQDERPSYPKLSSYIVKKASRQVKLVAKCAHCRQDASPESLCICPDCNARPFHKDCWKDVSNHQPMEGFDICQPPVEYIEYLWVQYLLDSRTTAEEQKALHKKDIWSTWFEVPRKQDRPHLHVYPRLDGLIEAGRSTRDISSTNKQYPSLVSFFGETGGGKSTLIRALIRNAALSDKDSAPVPGNEVHRHKSTSGDVHLYSDPKTINNEVPLFYADCEGLRGAGISAAAHVAEGDEDERDHKENVKGSVLRKTPYPPLGISPAAIKAEVDDHRRTVRYKLDLQWGTTSVVDTGNNIVLSYVVDDRTRQAIVKDLYPRFLYAFSDVVCYITNNPKATESELMHLFDWASKGHERTINQRVRPGLVIIVNKDSPKLEKEWLDVDYATKELLAHLQLSAAFAELRERWRLRGKVLRTAEDLILCYYDSFRIVCIPTLTPKTAHIIAGQYEKLYAEITATSNRLREKKAKLRMRLDVQSFGKYMDVSLGRLAKALTSSIDFHHLAMKFSQRPVTFVDHVAALLKKVKDREDVESIARETEIVTRLTPFIACAIAPSIIKGESEKAVCSLELARQEKVNWYMQEFSEALERFRDSSWRCETVMGGQRCKNYYVGHEKGHQFGTRGNPNLRKYSSESSTSISSTSLFVGEFQCSIERDKLVQSLYAELNQLLDKHDDIETSTSLVAQASRANAVSSNWTCFSCLSQCPVYKLPCEQVQHTICEKCATRFTGSDRLSQSTLLLERCPLGCYFKHGAPWRSRIKPPAAGVRLLSLDGGGIRGIIELMILKRLVAEVGFDIPVQELFDLVIGTSTGGIVALGLFKMNWSVDKAITEFEKLSKDAFAKRQWLKVPMFRHTAQLLYSYRFESEGIETALQKVFGQKENLFGSNDLAMGEKVKVGVVAANGQQPSLLTNYSRNSTGIDSDYLVRAENSEDDLKTWEAARSTSAAPTYFAPYLHQPTNTVYVDGAMQRNNPVQFLEDERRAIWGQKTPPDIILSLGTGIQTNNSGDAKTRDVSLKVIQKLVPNSLKNKVAVGIGMVQSTLDCNRQWKEFLNSTQWNHDISRVCHRLNVGLNEKPPHLDDVDKLQALKLEAELSLRPENEKYLHRGPYIDSNYRSGYAHVKFIARRLLATLFYFEPGMSMDHWIIGVLHCRLSSSNSYSFRQLMNGSPEFRASQYDRAKGKSTTVLAPTFSSDTFSSPIQFQVDDEKYVIEMKLPRWEDWETISGFSAYV